MHREGSSSRPELRFLVVYLLVLGGCFTVVALQPVNDALVVPYTTLVARMAGAVLALLGEEITVAGCLLRSPRFAVTIYNGCNGLITSIVFVAGVVAFPSRLTAKLAGVAGGLIVIQVVNLIRIVALYYTGVFLPDLFDSFHVVVWQSIVILSGVALWIAWATLFASPPAAGERRSSSGG